MTPESRLVSAIIAQVIRDLFGGLGSTVSDTMRTSTRRSAMRWLTAEKGADAADRNHLCSLVGLDGDELRRRIIAILDGKLPPPLMPDGRSMTDFSADALALWAEKKARDANDRNAREVNAAAVAVDRATWLARTTATAEKRRAEADHRDHVARQTAAAVAELEARLASAIAQDPKVQQAAALIRALADGPMTSRQLCNVARLDYEPTRDRLSRAQAVGLVEKVGRTWMLAAPREVPALP